MKKERYTHGIVHDARGVRLQKKRCRDPLRARLHLWLPAHVKRSRQKEELEGTGGEVGDVER